MDGDIPGGRSGPLYGSEGWGFESLRARSFALVRALLSPAGRGAGPVKQ